MAIIPIIKLKPGMVLKSAAIDTTGRLLLGEGAEIAQKHITLFKTWGMTEVDIEGDVEAGEAEDISTQVDEETLQRTEKELQELFIFTDLTNSQVIKEIFRVSMQLKTGMLREV
jgi:hypothetical protein